MRVKFHYTPEDLWEVAIPEAHATDLRKYNRRWIVTLIPWVVLILVAGFEILVWNSALQGSDADRPSESVLLEVLPPGLPAAFLVGGCFVLIWKGWRKSRYRVPQGEQSPPGKGTSRLLLRLLSWFLFGVIGFAMFKRTGSMVWHPSAIQLMLVRIMPWALVIFTFMLFGRLRKMWLPRQQWFTQPTWSRPKVVEMDEREFRLSDPLMHTSMLWSCFARVRETQNLLILVTLEGLQYIVPKRAFNSAEDVEQCRALLQNSLPRCQFLVRPSGFAIVPKAIISGSNPSIGATTPADPA
jgi:hypothetical protein